MSLSDTVKSVGVFASDTLPDLRKTGIDRDYWYPLAQSRQLQKGKVIGVSFAGEPIALVRTKSGTLFALEDRCAHRQIPLHAGVVCGESLQCSYHCWTYNKSGQCINVPYLDRNKSLPNGVRSYPCREAYGLIFVFPGDLTKLNSADFPEIPSSENPQYKTRYLDREVRCHYSFMHENLMDMNHQFLHRQFMGKIKTTLLELRTGDRWVEADYTFSRVAGRQPLGEKFILGAKASPKTGRTSDIMTIRTQYPYQTLKYWSPGSEDPALDLWNVYVPVDREQVINHTFGLMMIQKPPFPGLIHVLWPFITWFTENIFAEDRRIVEQEQKAFDLQGADWNQEIFPVICELRSLLKRQGLPSRDSQRSK